MRIPIQFEVQGEPVISMLHVSTNALPTDPVVVMGYGFNGNMCEVHRMSVKLAQRCEAAGIHMLRFDYRGHGHSIGDTLSITLDRKRQDLLEAIYYINSCFGIHLPIYLIGFSDGARITASVANQIENLTGLIYWNPVFSMEPAQTDAKQITAPKRMIRDEHTGRIVKELYGMKINISYYRECMKNNVCDQILKDKPEMYILSDDDKNMQSIRQLFMERYRNNHEMHIIHNAGHLFENPQAEKEAMNLTIDWIAKRGSESV